MLTVGALLTPLLAQENTTTEPVIKDVEGLRLQLVQHTQDPVTQQVKFELVVYSQVESDRVQVTWTVSGSGKLVNDPKQTIPKIEKNQVYRVEGIVLPQVQGTIDLLVKVEAFAADGVRLSTARQTVGVFPTKEVYPITSQYRIAQIAIFIRTLSILGIVIIVGFFAIKFGYAKFREWLDHDDPDKIEEHDLAS